MKVQIVYLSPEDDIHSTRDMLGWVKASRALLVWPDHGNVLTRQLDLVLLKRFSYQRNIEIGLLTFDREIRDESAKIGIPVFDSMDDLPEGEWNVGYRSQESLQRGGGLDLGESSIEIAAEQRDEWFERLKISQKVFLFLGIFIFFIVLIGLFMPSAQVILSPAPVRRSFELTVDLGEADSEEMDASLITPQVIRLQSEGVSNKKSSGLTQVPISTATGHVILTSLSQEIIEIPAGTTFRTAAENSVRFKTTRPAVINGEIGSQVEVPIKALSSGWRGNVLANTITMVEGPLGLIVTVSNPEPTSGGRAEIRKMVLQKDLIQLEETLIQDLMKVAEQEWATSNASDWILVEDSLELVGVIEEQFDHVVGDIVDTISLELSAEFSALSLSTVDLYNLAMTQISKGCSTNELPVPGTVKFSSQMRSASDGFDQGWVDITIELDTYRVLDVESMKRLIRGLRPFNAAHLLLNRYSLSDEPEFVLKPSWYPFLPILDQRIDFNWNWEIGL